MFFKNMAAFEKSNQDGRRCPKCGVPSIRNDYYKINQYSGLRKVKLTPKMPWMLGKSA
jgi:hypothetical protein